MTFITMIIFKNDTLQNDALQNNALQNDTTNGHPAKNTAKTTFY
jgi:hypothetical protein